MTGLSLIMYLYLDTGMCSRIDIWYVPFGRKDPSDFETHVRVITLRC